MSKKRTISKHFNDDEIIGRLPNGDLILKPGVRKKYYDSFDADLSVDAYINYEVIKQEKQRESYKKHFGGKEDSFEEIDNWDTE